MNNDIENNYKPANANLKQTLANFSHTLRNPLTSVLGWTEILLMSESNNVIEDDLDLHEVLEVIRSNSVTLVRLVSDLSAILGPDLSPRLVFELRVPLTAIIGSTEMLLLIERDNPIDNAVNLHEILDVMRGNGKTFDYLVSQLNTLELNDNRQDAALPE
jgi:signal transduction histidine kinase